MSVNNSIPCMNYKAITLLRDGRYSEAAEILKEAVTQLLLSVEGGPSEELNRPSFESWKMKSVNIKESSGCSKEAKQVQDHTALSLYDRAFVMDIAAHDAEAFTSVHSPSLVSASLLYNLGLAYHFMGMAPGGSQKSSLEKALKLYKSVLAVVGRDPTSDFGNLFSLAAWNNMGHIYAQVFSTSRVRHCLEHLISIMALINSAANENLSEDYLHFRMNIWLLHGKDVTVAPAA